MKVKLMFYQCCFREVFGPNGQLIEIMNEEDQQLALNVTRSLNPMYPRQWTYWWTGLEDRDEDHVWRWNRSKQIAIIFIN